MSSGADAPSWEHITDEIECVRCGYNLRGLASPRCPECGLDFEWADLFDPARRRHPYLFEHQAQRGVGRAFLRTARGALNPLRFWETLGLQQPCIARRLFGFWVLFVGAYCCCLPVWYAVLHDVAWVNALPFPLPVAAGTSVLVWVLGRLAWWLMVFSLPLLVQGATVAALLIFQQSLGHWRIRSYHVIRCGVYGAAALLPGTLLLGMGYGLWLLAGSGLLGRVAAAWLPSPETSHHLVAGLIGWTLLHWSVSLWCAYRRYLKIRRPLGMLMSSQVIALLVVLIVLVGPISRFSHLVGSWFVDLF